MEDFEEMNKLLTAIVIFSFVAATGLVTVEFDERAAKGTCLVRAALGHLVASSAGAEDEAPLARAGVANPVMDCDKSDDAVILRVSLSRDAELGWRWSGSSNEVVIDLGSEFDGECPCRGNEHPAG